jgi:hypothetical protein
MAVADTATTAAGAASLGAITTTASTGVATATTVVGMATTVAATATMGAATGTPAKATVTPVVATATPGAVDPVMPAAMDVAQVAVAAMVVRGVEAPTATEAVDPAAADIGNSPGLIQQRTGTADSSCCQPFSTVRQLLVAVGDNPILRLSRAYSLFLLVPDF